MTRRGNRRGTTGNGAVSCDESEVGASQTGGVIAVDNNGAIAKEGGRALDGREVEVEIGGLEGTAGNIAMLARKVADLTVCRVLIVAWGCLAANIRV